MFKFRTAVSIAASAAAVIATAAHAQQPPAAPVAVAPMNCPDPGPPPMDRSGADGPRFQKRVETYKNCVSAYADVNNAKARALVEQSHVYTDAANKAVDEFNGYVATNNLNAKSPNQQSADIPQVRP